MTTELENSSAVNGSTVSGDASLSSAGNHTAPPPDKPVKRKRNLAGMPDPDAEVVALSPKTLMATNRFVCEICNKGFQRDQNLQLHRRGHNLPWKLKQRTSKEIRKRVYVCPEPSCVHHDPKRALGDLTGIKKHFCRKHGEKKWKCDQCSKKYAVQSDWKAHLKICGTREYKCDCGTLFSRRDSFITHRAFCDALAVETAKHPPEDEPTKEDEEPSPLLIESAPQSTSTASPPSPPTPLPLPPPPPQPAAAPALPVTSSVLCVAKTPDLPEIAKMNQDSIPVLDGPPQVVTGLTRSCNASSTNTGSTSSSVFASLFASSTASKSFQAQPQTSGFKDFIQTMSQPTQTPNLTLPSSVQEPVSLCLSTSQGTSIFRTAGQDLRQYAPPPQPTMSATALLQKAAQMGASASGASLLRGYGLERDDADVGASIGLGLGVGYDGRSGLQELMMGTPSVYGPKHATLDFLGLGMAVGGGTTNGLSALMTSIGGNLDVTPSFGRGGSGEFPGKDIGPQ
ncbi:putative transcription factor C2H2 family [Helianthus annuus]|nr:putative transcription factor C2H2 family [Helianthus annuus]KAJ0659796.1 putative transcription factor C2H2 family [Helianthus annuus]KAJ0840177.1 putative transcription factor C2H2 family [Helianthus annuus]KAJ0853552.1 putative transcription factor C2H2 family [Helianthus annuus]